MVSLFVLLLLAKRGERREADDERLGSDEVNLRLAAPSPKVMASQP